MVKGNMFVIQQYLLHALRLSNILILLFLPSIATILAVDMLKIILRKTLLAFLHVELAI